MEKKNGWKTVIVYIIIIALFLLPELSYALEDAALPAWLTNDYARIVDMDYKAVVIDEPGSDGKIVVTERMTFDIHAASRDNGFWELWRDLCEDTIDGVKVHYKVNSVKLITSSGKEIPWEESDKLYWDDYDYVRSNSKYGPSKWYHSPGPYNEYARQYECVFFYIDDVYREKMTFEIEYEMYNAALRYGDCSDLYIAMYSGDTTRYLESFDAEILIPDKDMPKEGNYEFTTYGTNDNSFPVKESKTKNPGYHTFSFSLDEDDLKFRPYNEFIEFDLISYGEDKHIFTEHASRNHYYDDPALEEIRDEQAAYANAPAKYLTIKLGGLAICLLVATLVLLGGRGKINKLNKKYPSSANAQEIETYRDIPSDLDPKFAAALVFSKQKKKEDDAGVYASLLLSLARKKYIEIEETAEGRTIIKLPDEQVPETPLGYMPNRSSAPESYYDDGVQLAQHEVMGRFGPYRPAINTQPSNFEPRYVRENEPSISDYLSRRQPEDMGRPVNGNNIYRTNTPSQIDNPFENNYTPITTVSDTEWNTPMSTTWEDEWTCSCGAKMTGKFCMECGQPKPIIPETIVAAPEIQPEPIEPCEPLTICEDYYYKLLKRHAMGGQITMATLQSRVSDDFDYTKNFADKIKRSVVDTGISKGYFQKADYQEPQKKLRSYANFSIGAGVVALIANFFTYSTRLDLLFGGLFIVAAALIINGLYLKKRAHKYVLLTEFGEEEYQKWHGLYNFLNSDTLIKEREVVELPLWEKYLVYATAFDISEKVIAAIKIRCPEMDPNSIVSNPVCRSGRIRMTGRSFHSSVRSGYHSASYGGGYGGYGGGGRGGGGGGGGH